MGAYFELILVILTVASIVIAIVDKVFFAKARLAKAAEAPDFASLSKKQKYKRARAPLVCFWCVSCAAPRAGTIRRCACRASAAPMRACFFFF